jgi:hypothetical protein
MPELNADCPRFEVLVRSEFLYNFQKGMGEYAPGICHSITSIPGRALGFNVLLNNGAHIGRLPIHALAHRRDRVASVPHDDPWRRQLWDCFSANVAVVEYAYLSGMRCRVSLADRKVIGGVYMFTVDYWGSPAAESAGNAGWKCHHLIALDDGTFAAQPNNRICLFEPSCVTPFEQPPDYKTMERVWRVEDGARWRTSDDSAMFYGVQELNQ